MSTSLVNPKSIVEKYLGNDRRIIDIKSIQIIESDFSKNTDVIVEYLFNGADHDNPNPIQSYGDGFVDALVNGFVGRFEEEYKSLKNMKLCRFEVSAKTKKNNIDQFSASKVFVEIGIKTPSSKELFFQEEDVSLVRACTRAVREAVQFMLNCEETVKVLQICLEDAKKRNRHDSITQYTNDLVELVKITSYENVLQ